MEEECQRRSQGIEKETKVKDEKQEEKHVQASDTSEGKHSSMDENYECNDDEFVLTGDEEEVLLKANDALTCMLLDIDLKFYLRLKKKILRSFESYKEETKPLFMRMKFKNKNLEDELENQNNEIGRLKSELAREQEKIDKIPKELEETRRNNIGLRTQLEEEKRIEEAMKL